MDRAREIRAAACLFLTSLIWGFSFVAQVVGMDFMRPFTFNGVSFLIGAGSLVPVILAFERKGRGSAEKFSPWGLHWKYGLVCGLILFCASNFQQFGVDLTGSAGKSGFITGLYIIIVPIAGIFMKQRATALTWAGAAFAVAGMFFLSVLGGLSDYELRNWTRFAFGNFEAGDLALLVGSLFWAAHIIAVGKCAQSPAVSPLRLSMIQFLICGAMCMGCAFFAEPIEPAMWIAAATPLLYRGIGSIGVAYTLQVVGQRHVAPAKASVIFSLESVFSAIGGFLIIGEVMTAAAYIGCGLIFCGIILSQLPVKRG